MSRTPKFLRAQLEDGHAPGVDSVNIRSSGENGVDLMKEGRKVKEGEGR
jgi:hypothetical protein